MARPKKKAAGKPDFRMSYFFFVLAVLAFALGAWGSVQGALTLRWPRVEAKIVDAKLTLHERETRDVQRPDRWHTFDVHYFYVAGGKTYLGGGIEPYDFGMQNSAGAVKMKERFPVGSTAPVAVDPQNPSVAYLMPGPSSFSLALMGIGVAFALIGGLARRMIRVGPGEDKDDTPAPPLRKEVEVDPKIAALYPKRSTTEPRT